MAHLNTPDLEPSPNLFYSYGAILGDGTIEKDGRYGVKLGVTNHTFANSFERALNKLGLRNHSWSQKQKNGSNKIVNVYYVKVYSKALFNWLKSDLEIPRKFYVDFLRGFFEAEGCNALELGNQVKFYNSNKKLLGNIKRMIQTLGYSSNIIEQEQHGFGTLPIYTLYLLGGKSAGFNFLQQLDPCIKGVG